MYSIKQHWLDAKDKDASGQSRVYFVRKHTSSEALGGYFEFSIYILRTVHIP